MFNGNNSGYSIIVDNRTEADFKKLTFLKHKRTQVFKQLEKNIYNGDVEQSAHWTAELLCSGYLSELLDFFAITYSKFININNPIFPYFLMQAYVDCNKIKNEKRYLQNPIEIRNNEKIRTIVCRIAICLTTSVKGAPNLFTLAKLSNQDFQEPYFKSKLVQTQNYLAQIAKDSDNPQIIIVGNQIVNSIVLKDISKVVYWISWILQWEKLKLKENKNIFVCQPRMFEGVDSKFYCDITWFIWEIIINIPTHNENKKHIIALLKLYSHEFTKPKRTIRIPIMLNAIMILITNPDYKIPLIRDTKLLKDATRNVGVLYEEIKIKLNSYRELPQQIQQKQYEQQQIQLQQMQEQQLQRQEEQQQQQTLIQVDEKPKKVKKEKKPKQKPISKEQEESMKKLDIVDEIFNTKFMT